MRIEYLMDVANPVPNRPDAELSARARAELTTLTGVTESPVRAPTGVGRRRLVLGLTAGCAVVLAAGVGVAMFVQRPQPPSAAEPFYQTAVALEGRADVIVRATIERTREHDRDGTSETVATARVYRTGKGDVAVGQTVELTYTTPGSGPPETPDGLHKGAEYVLLLELVPNAPANMVSTVQGYYLVENGRAIPDRANTVNLSETVLRRLDLR